MQENELERLPETKQTYSELLLGNREICGMIDAPHAKKFEKDDLDKITYIKFWNSRNGKLEQAPAGQVFINEVIRKRLGVKAGDKLGRFTVHEGRKASSTSGVYLPIVVAQHEREEFIDFLFAQYEAKLKKGCDVRTGKIARIANKQYGVTVIIGTVNRQVVDLNRPLDGGSEKHKLYDLGAQRQAILEYRKQKSIALKHAGILGERAKLLKPYLHIALHGKASMGIAVGTVDGDSCTSTVQHWFAERLKAKLGGSGIKERNGESPQITSNDTGLYRGDSSKVEGRKAHGINYNSIQVEIGEYLRLNYDEKLAQILADILKEFTVEMSDRQLQRSATRNKLNAEILHVDYEKLGSKSVFVGRQYKAQVGQNIVTVSPQLASDLKLQEGGEVQIVFEGKRLNLKISLNEKIRNSAMLFDQAAREKLGLSPDTVKKVEIWVRKR